MRTSSPGPPGQANAAPWRSWLLPGIIVAFFVALFALPRGAAAGLPLTYTQFVADVGAGTVRAVTIGPAGQVTGSLASGQPFTTTIPVALGGNGLAGDLAAHHVQVTATATAATSSALLSVLAGLLPLLLIGGLIYFVVRGARQQARGLGGGLGALTSVTKAKARVIDAERPATRFTDVAGYAAVKTEISEVVDYLRDPGRYHRAGARGPRGVLMAGPPGTGKTLLARAVAGEAHVPFLSVSGSGFVEMFGLSEAIGPVSYSGPPAGYPAPAGSRGYSEHTQWLVDQEVAALLARAETRARDLLTSHRQALDRLTAALLEQETVTGDQVRAIAQVASPPTDGRPPSLRLAALPPVAGQDHAE